MHPKCVSERNEFRLKLTFYCQLSIVVLNLLTITPFVKYTNLNRRLHAKMIAASS